MVVHQWFLFSGIFLLTMVIADRWLKRGPVSSAIIYLLFGLFLGPRFADLLELDQIAKPGIMEFIAEIVVVISLFTAGLKMQGSVRHYHWKISAILATAAMILTVMLLALTGHYLFALPIGAAILLGGILAPTDPVLASDVQVQDEKDRDLIRRSLTGEAGMNDGMAFPVVMLGLTILGTRWSHYETPSWRWALIDIGWSIPGGIAIGAGCGWLAAKLIISFRAKTVDKLVIEDFVSIGVICASYGLAQVVSTYGFLAVFAAGVCFARVENNFYKRFKPKDTEGFSPALIRFSTQLERIGEIAIVVLVGYLAGTLDYSGRTLLLPILLIFVIRPIAVFLCLGWKLRKREATIISWFGIRGIGSIYYLYYAINHGFTGPAAEVVFNLIMVTIVISIVAHGISSTPIMKFYETRRKSKTKS